MSADGLEIRASSVGRWHFWAFWVRSCGSKVCVRCIIWRTGTRYTTSNGIRHLMRCVECADAEVNMISFRILFDYSKSTSALFRTCLYLIRMLR